MTKYGNFYQSDGRYIIKFDRLLPHSVDTVWDTLTDPKKFSKWYPFATGEMDLKRGGKIAFDDGEGTTYEGIIEELEAKQLFSFQEVDDFIEIQLKPIEEGCRFVFNHRFNDQSMAIYTAAGWHRCLDVFQLLVEEKPVIWEDNAPFLREAYREAFHLD